MEQVRRWLGSPVPCPPTSESSGTGPPPPQHLLGAPRGALVAATLSHWASCPEVSLKALWPGAAWEHLLTRAEGTREGAETPKGYKDGSSRGICKAWRRRGGTVGGWLSPHRCWATRKRALLGGGASMCPCYPQPSRPRQLAHRSLVEHAHSPEDPGQATPHHHSSQGL